MRHVSILLTVSILFATGVASHAAEKTPAQCSAEYRANKAKIEGAQTEAEFLTACQAGQEPVAGATTAALPAVPPAVAAQQPATPASTAGQAKAPAP